MVRTSHTSPSFRDCIERAEAPPREAPAVSRRLVGRTARKSDPAPPGLDVSPPCVGTLPLARIPDEDVRELVRLVDDVRFSRSRSRWIEVVALTVADRERILWALDDVPTDGLAELRGVLLSEHELRPEDETGYGAASEGDMEDAPDQVQPQTREPASEEESEQDAYANTADARDSSLARRTGSPPL